ncbi:MAG: nucleotidyltransferase domain-containing protein [Elusimicrobiota bacterium]
MRLKKQEIESIKKITVECFGADAKVFLFGSRTNDSKRGGDIDLYIETKTNKDILQKKLRMLKSLSNQLGEQKFDIVINNFRTNKLIYTIAQTEGIAL